ncbi:MAG: excinuclease ABC subunit UvrC [Candidatus Thorarchaeota archaeon]|nr:MAG: excinuclease ABC subunit C [Candidatus Thorarchaeota archaeon]
MSDLATLVRDLPDSPGVYLWKDAKGNILYIGKAKSLRKRVSSYLRKRGLFRRTWEMIQQARDIETILTNTEREALVLEQTLIKKHQPKYNLALKDDRRHAWIRVDRQDEIPTFEITRNAEKDGATYFGPYGSTKRLERFMDTVRRYIPVAMCRDPAKVKRACMDYHLDRCAAPCEGLVSGEEYDSLVEQMCLFIEGRAEDLSAILRTQMEEASHQMEFEKAAELRDRLADIEILMSRQKVVEFNGINRDVLGISRTEQAALVEMLIIRGGRMIDPDHFYFETDLDVPDREILKAFVEQFYFAVPRLPDEIVLPCDIDNRLEMSEWLSDMCGHDVCISLPTDERRLELVEMANKNAHRTLRKILILGERQEDIVHDGVKELKEALGLSQAPMHIEGFDIANIQGTDPTGSCVVFTNGEPDNKRYRMFRVRVKETPDDYAMMREVVYRRYKGVLEKGGRLPDLILIDGGKGQLGVALEALAELGLDYVPVVAVAKKEEIMYTRDNREGIQLSPYSEGLHLVQQVRDEAHRFAQKYHHKLREKRFSGSILEDAPGIGPKRRAALLDAFGSFDGVRGASAEDLARVDGMTLKSARNLRDWLDENHPL